jgi:hypothetical protein
VLAYLNRLSDVVWLFGRLIELNAGIDARLRDGNQGTADWSEMVESLVGGKLGTGTKGLRGSHEWPFQGQLFGTAYATFFTESRIRLARGAQLKQPDVFSIIYGTTKVVP